MKHFLQSKLLLCVTVTIFALISNPVFATPQFTQFEENYINPLMDFRLSLTTLEPMVAYEKVDSFGEKLIKGNLSKEETLILETFLVLEKYNYLYENNQKDPRIKDLIMPQIAKIDAFLEENKNGKLNKWFYCIAGDAFSCCMQFLPMGDAMNRGLRIKDFYLEALKQDPNMNYGLINAGQWFFQAPAIGGGSKIKAKNYFEHALEVARNKAEKYYASIMLSQFRFDEGNVKKCDELLNQAENLVPGSKTLTKVRNVNSVGSTWFYYVVHREEINKKIAKNESKK